MVSYWADSSATVGFEKNFKIKKPPSPAVSDEKRMTILALLIMVASSKASRVIKIDMVKPMPANKPTPTIDFQFKSGGSLQSFTLTAKNVSRKMPSGLPTTSPRAIPRL